MPDREKVMRGLWACAEEDSCDSCPYEYIGCRATLAEDVIALLKEQEARWIPVTEQYPEERKAVLVYQRMYKNTYCAFLEGMDWWIYGGYGTKAFGITHWKPLPEPPKEDENV